MEHWPAAVMAGLLGLIMTLAVIAIGVRLAGPEPTATLPDNFPAQSLSVTHASAH
jgi:hypothetical protein